MKVTQDQIRRSVNYHLQAQHAPTCRFEAFCMNHEHALCSGCRVHTGGVDDEIKLRIQGPTAVEAADAMLRNRED